MCELIPALGGDIVPAMSLVAPKARELATLLEEERLPHARLVECRTAAGGDVVFLEVDVEVSQLRAYDVRPVEPLAVVFDHTDRFAPEVLAWRTDFPVVPHLNLRAWETPRSLCLFEERYRDLKRRWTAAMFVTRIREWLRLTARGELHAVDQPLEPLLLDIDGILVLPHGLFDVTQQASEPIATDGSGQAKPLPSLTITRRQEHRNRLVLVAERASTQTVVEPQSLAFVAAAITCGARPHGMIRHTPRSLKELHELTAESGTDLLGHLRGQLVDWKEKTTGLLDARLVLVIAFPKTREAGAVVEASDVWAFLTVATVRDIGAAVGCWAIHEGNIGALIGGVNDVHQGEEIKVGLLDPVFTLSRAAAARYNGRPAPSEQRVVAVGGGTLGSQLMINLVRAAFGRWVLIDDDLLLPHNLARHALDGTGIGWPKAEVLAAVANSLIDGGDPMTALVADVLEPGHDAAAVAEHLRTAEAILDLSASVTVARHLARDVDAGSRRISFFLNPAGTDLTLLAEDRDRTIPLDALEMQYYRALVHRVDLSGHLGVPGTRLRYGRSCRDVSVQLPQHLAALHAAIGAGVLPAILAANGAAIRVWRADRTSLAVDDVNIEPAPVHKVRLGEWTLYMDAWLLDRLAGLRVEKLPNETGGVLVGAFDLERRIAYVVDTVPSPPDSQEWPVLYIRGCEGLPNRVREIMDVTAGQLHYIGEWHSHPDGYGCCPSNDDLQVFTWLTEHMEADGLPALMMIVGDDGMVVPYLGQMLPPESACV